jgi:hypothetical protein
MVQTPSDGAKTHYSKDIGAVCELIRNGRLRAIVSTAGALLIALLFPRRSFETLVCRPFSRHLMFDDRVLTTVLGDGTGSA